MADDNLLQSAHVEISVHNGTKAGLNQVRDDFRNTARQADSSANSIKESLDKLKASAGRRSGIGEFAEVLRGAGAVAGIAIVGEVLERATGKAAELTDEFRKGEISAKGLANGILESLPIIGSFVQAAGNIKELITGERAAHEKVNEEIRYGNQLYAMRTALAKANEDSNIRAENALRSASQRLREAEAQPGIQRSVQAKQDATNSQESQLRLEYSPMMNSRRQQEAADKLLEDENKEIDAAKTPEQVEKIKARYAEKSQITKQAIDKYNSDLALRNQATIKTLDKATALEVKEIESGTAEIFGIRMEAANKLAETTTGKLENFRAGKVQEGYQGQALDNLVQAKNESLRADALAGTRDQLRDLDKSFRDSSATTFDEKVKANRVTLEEEARTGKITKESIDDLNQAYANLQHVEVTNKIKEADIALKEVSKTDLDKQVSALQRMGANAAEAAKYAQQLKDTLTGTEIKDISNQLGLVGKNPLQAAGIAANQKGADGTAVAAATGKLLGAQLTDSLKTPFQDFQRTVQYYRELLQAGDISQKTFLLAQQKAFDGLIDQTQTSDIDTFARNHVNRTLAGAGILSNMANGTGNQIPAVNAVNQKADDEKKKKEQANADAKNKALNTNTDSLEKLEKTVGNLIKTFEEGIAAVCV